MIGVDALRAALAGHDDLAGELAGAAIEPLPVKGLAHDHLRLVGSGWLLRVPKQSQFGFAAGDNLAYQAACFRRVAESGHGPRLRGLLPPSPELPMGALVVEEIVGRPPRLPSDLPALAEAMARVHALPLPEVGAMPPLAHHADPVAGALEEIRAQAAFIEVAGLHPESAAQLHAEFAWAEAFAAGVAGRGVAQAGDGRPQPVTLALTDTHPGNFLVEPGGRAVIVDLEKALYGSPGIDLAHATVYSSTTWDLDVHAELSVAEVAGFYRRYLRTVADFAGPEPAARLRPWLLPMRRLLALRALTWCVKWSVLHHRSALADKHAAATTEDWSADNSDPALIAHVAGRVALYLQPETVRRMRGEWLDAPGLDALIGASG